MITTPAGAKTHTPDDPLDQARNPPDWFTKYFDLRTFIHRKDCPASLLEGAVAWPVRKLVVRDGELGFDVFLVEVYNPWSGECHKHLVDARAPHAGNPAWATKPALFRQMLADIGVSVRLHRRDPADETAYRLAFLRVGFGHEEISGFLPKKKRAPARLAA